MAHASRAPDELVEFYDPTDVFGDLADALAEAYPAVAPELARRSRSDIDARSGRGRGRGRCADDGEAATEDVEDVEDAADDEASGDDADDEGTEGRPTA